MIKYVLLSLLAILLIIVGYFWFMRVSLLEHFLAKEMRASVHINKVVISFHEVIIEGFRIQNTFKTAEENAIKVSKIVMSMNPLNLLKKHIKIERLRFFHPVFGLELFNEDGSQNNWAAILNSGMNKNSSKQFTINHLELLEIEFSTYTIEGNKVPIWPIPYLELTDIGVPQGVSLNEFMLLTSRAIFSNMISKSPIDPIKNSIPYPTQVFKESPVDKIPSLQ